MHRALHRLGLIRQCGGSEWASCVVFVQSTCHVADCRFSLMVLSVGMVRSFAACTDSGSALLGRLVSTLFRLWLSSRYLVEAVCDSAGWAMGKVSPSCYPWGLAC